MLNHYQDNNLLVSLNGFVHTMPKLKVIVEAGRVLNKAKFDLALKTQDVAELCSDRLEAHRQHIAKALKQVKKRAAEFEEYQGVQTVPLDDLLIADHGDDYEEAA